MCLCFNMVSFGVKKSLDHTQISLLLGYNSKFLISIPAPFLCGASPKAKNSSFFVWN